MIKNPTYATFMKEVDSFISNLSNDDLKKIILNFAEKQNIKNRNEFLMNLRESDRYPTDSDEFTIIPDISPDKFIQQIRKYEERMKSGEFYDEEKSYWAYEREEHSYWRRNDYYRDFNDETDYSNEEYVLEAITLLEKAKYFFRHQDINTSLTAYEMLFNIFENPEYYDVAEYFIYGFSFEEAIDSDVLKEHKTIYLRCQYLTCKGIDNFKGVYHALGKERDIFLSDLIEIDRRPLPDLDKFINGFIHFLGDDAKLDSHLIDVLFVKGGMEEVKKYAYANGKQHPPVFLYYYEITKENKSAQSDQLNIILDGIKIIPEKYRIRSFLGLDFISIAKELNDKDNLLIGYSTAFYSNPTLRNLAFYINFIVSENINSEIERLRNYINKKDIKQSDSFAYTIDNIHDHRNIFSLDTAEIGVKALIVGRFLLDDIDSLIDFINPKHYLGFNGNKKYVAIVTAITLKAISNESYAIVVDKLLNHYCLDIHDFVD